jgi:alcohol dehydrogenase
MRMNKLLLAYPRQFQWQEEEIPPLQEDHVLVKTTLASFSSGRDLGRYLGSAPFGYPAVVGYEAVGTVAACGSGVKQLAQGDRVAAFYGTGTYGVVPESDAIKLPPGIPDIIGLMAGPSSRIINGIRKSNPKATKPILITGAGFQGLLTLYILKASGKEYVDVVEPLPERRRLAREMGSRWAVTREEFLDVGGLYPLAMECSSRNEAFRLLQERMLPEGIILVFSDGSADPMVLTPLFHDKRLTVIGSSHSEDNQPYSGWFFDQVRENPGRLKSMFDLTIGPGEIEETFRSLALGIINPIRIVLEF